MHISSLRKLVAAGAGGLVCLSLVTLAVAVDHLEAFNSARRGLQQQLRARKPEARIEAIEHLAEFPLEDAAKLVYRSMQDKEQAVREAGYQALLKMSGNQEVCDTLLDLARQARKRKDEPYMAATALAALLSSSLPPVQRDTLAYLDNLAGDPKGGLDAVITLVDELGSHAQACDVPPLVRLARMETFEQHRGLRRAVALALIKIPHRDAVGGLIEVMEKLTGEARADASEHLTQVTGQIFGMEAAAWARWWEDAHEGFQYPAASANSSYRSVAMKSASGYYYGLPMFAERMVFVLDTSGSMSGPRIVAAKQELVKAIESLPEHAHFGVVAFNRAAQVWQKELVPANEQWKRRAIAFVAGQTPQSNTASYDALETAFAFDTEAIYFLSDGAPTSGKIVAPVDIVAAITAANKTRRISVYTIGIGAGFPGSPLDVFLKALAEQNLGLYRRVD